MVPVEEIWSANSTNSRSITVALTVPRLAMVCEISRISSSCINWNSLAAVSSPTDMTSKAAFCRPFRER